MEKKAEIIARGDTMPPASTPPEVLALAITKGVDPTVLKQMLEVQERWEATEARKAYTRSMAAFKREAPAVLNKEASVDFSTSRGRTHYRYASLGGIIRQLTGKLSEHGLSVSFSCAQEGSGISVTCQITHERGHSECVTLTAPPDDSGNKNRIQMVGSTVTYLQRYTLLAALGLATADQDDDGIASGARNGGGSADAQDLAERFNGNVERGERGGTESPFEEALGDPASGAHPSAAPACPKCGAPVVDQRGQVSKAGKKLPAWRCSKGRYNRETKKTEGCDWTEWDTDFFETPTALEELGQTRQSTAPVADYKCPFCGGKTVAGPAANTRKCLQCGRGHMVAPASHAGPKIGHSPAVADERAAEPKERPASPESGRRDEEPSAAAGEDSAALDTPDRVAY